MKPVGVRKKSILNIGPMEINKIVCVPLNIRI